ncbi:TetR/AcrR family transcriptional regulator [Rhodococcus sp. ZPP]|uniref:TetR/AcrR family transcriptional regulator n=1 Tax=Rhodococcus sp. ZPP TaxID=2749906 RepID=UPI001AD89F15|nr:TetR/AcrR family transcriptional regulator [Rhodococcus sp. ZPP]QTJ65106.1 TetR/AcrR family transcriptional regulator [Rhodococcus sp. ZPP]
MTDLQNETPAPGGQPIHDLSSSEERLLAAATMLFSDKGFEATTTRDISAVAGLSPAAMYVHFPSKEELLFRLVSRAHERALTQALDAVAPFTDPVDRVRALVRDFSMLHATNFRKARIAQYESRHLSAEHREVVAQTRLQIRVAAMREVRRGIDEGVFLIPDPRVAVLAIMSLAIDICRWYDPDGEFAPEELGDINADLVLRILRAPGY